MQHQFRRRPLPADGAPDHLSQNHTGGHGCGEQQRTPGVPGEETPGDAHREHDERKRHRPEHDRQDDHHGRQNGGASLQQPLLHGDVDCCDATLAQHTHQHDGEEDGAGSQAGDGDDLQRAAGTGPQIPPFHDVPVIERAPRMGTPAPLAFTIEFRGQGSPDREGDADAEQRRPDRVGQPVHLQVGAAEHHQDCEQTPGQPHPPEREEQRQDHRQGRRSGDVAGGEGPEINVDHEIFEALGTSSAEEPFQEADGAARHHGDQEGVARGPGAPQKQKKGDEEGRRNHGGDEAAAQAVHHKRYGIPHRCPVVGHRRLPGRVDGERPAVSGDDHAQGHRQHHGHEAAEPRPPAGHASHYGVPGHVGVIHSAPADQPWGASFAPSWAMKRTDMAL